MDAKQLLKALQENAVRTSVPIPVEIPGIGQLFVRKRTVLEYEQMSDLRKQLASGQADTAGILGVSLARLLCDENGNRFTVDEELEIGKMLAKQPEDVMNNILSASDGEPPPPKGDEKSEEAGPK